MIGVIFIGMKTKKEFSIFRYQYWMQTGLSEIEARQKVSEIQKQNSKKSIQKFKPEYSLLHKEYWMLRKGMTEEEAIKKVSSLQKIYSSKSSKFTGKTRTIDEKRRISNSMQKKIAIVGSGTWARHFGEFNGNSKIEKEVFLYIKENINSNVSANVPISQYIVDIIDGKKIIEFYGDFWHASPLIFNENDLIKSFSINKLASEIWEYDDVRTNRLKSMGYDILIIWENEWKTKKEDCIRKIKEYYDKSN